MYIPSCVLKWESLRAEVRCLDTGAVAIKGAPYTGSCGYMPVFVTRDECVAAFPEFDVIQMEEAFDVEVPDGA